MTSTSTGFGIAHLPYGVFDAGRGPQVGVRFGNGVLDVAAAIPELTGWFDQPNLHRLMAAGPPAWAQARVQITDYLTVDPSSPQLIPLDQVSLALPFAVADYVDFYASENHATNLGRLFRPNSEPLLPNWKHLPVGYHGRAGTVVVSGTDIRRPSGQTKAPDAQVPSFGASTRLDIEAELGFVVGVGSTRGNPVTVDAFADHVFGVCLVNDWSARDIQAWEYVPLGPFLGKSFATSVSAWVTPLAALEAARRPAPARDVPLLPYLADSHQKPGWALDLSLEVSWNGTVVSRPPFAGMYWTGAQMLAHTTVNGASARTGDLFASGTISGPDHGTEGSFIELSHGGGMPITLDDGSTRTFLHDGDVVTIRATVPATDGNTLTLGEVTGMITPAIST